MAMEKSAKILLTMLVALAMIPGVFGLQKVSDIGSYIGNQTELFPGSEPGTRSAV